VRKTLLKPQSSELRRVSHKEISIQPPNNSYIFTRNAVALQPNSIQTLQRCSVADSHRKRWYIPVDHRTRPDHGDISEPYKLVYPYHAPNDDSIPHRYMPSQRRAIRHNATASDQTIVPNVSVRHKQVGIAHPR